MGTWVCHLRVAEQIFSRLPGLDETAFILGSLAPDSGIPNADWTVFDPPKSVTHFLLPGEGEDKVRDLLFYRQHLASLRLKDDTPRFSFILAYFCHLLCDSLWARRIWWPSKAAYAGLIAGQGMQKAVELIKDDWYGLDQCYVRDHPDSSFWRVLMPSPNPPDWLDFIPTAALGHQLDYIRRFYSQPDPAWVLDRPYCYLNEATMRRFVGDCAAAALKVYDRLLAGWPDNGSDSSMGILDDEDKASYLLPLGDEVVESG